MSLREGSKFRCTIGHEFESESLDEFNEHNKQHTLSGNNNCILCNREVKFKGIPYQPLGVNGFGLKLICPECGTMNLGSGTIELVGTPEQ